jgi:hypothetical protein
LELKFGLVADAISESTFLRVSNVTISSKGSFNGNPVKENVSYITATMARNKRENKIPNCWFIISDNSWANTIRMKPNRIPSN